jgi:DNA-binding protein HU-beta
LRRIRASRIHNGVSKNMATAAKKAPAKKAAAKAGAAAKVNTVSLKNLAAALSESHELPKKQTEAVLNDMVAMIGKHLKKGDRIRIPGLGIMMVRKRPARMGRNPATGEPVKIKASKKVAFRVAKDLKESI